MRSIIYDQPSAFSTCRSMSLKNFWGVSPSVRKLLFGTLRVMVNMEYNTRRQTTIKCDPVHSSAEY